MVFFFKFVTVKLISISGETLKDYSIRQRSDAARFQGVEGKQDPSDNLELKSVPRSESGVYLCLPDS